MERSPSEPVAIVGVRLQNAGGVAVDLSDGRTLTIPVEWALDNSTNVRHATGQKTTHLFDLVADLEHLPKYVDAELNASGDIAVGLSDGRRLVLPGAQLLKYGARKGFSVPNFVPASAFRQDLPDVDRDVPHHSWDRFLDSNEAVSAALLDLAEAGLIIIDNCPPDMDAVIRLARRIDVEQHTLYGTSWTVQTAPTEGPKNNVAYTSEYLDFHHDLVYYQSPPGLQLLHCVKFLDSVVGGESLFIDGFMVAEELRARDLAAFQDLCTIPAAFMKDDLERSQPAQFYYSTPHIHLNHEGAITEMRWAPAFEAPIPLADPELVRRYYRAKAQFWRVLDDLRKRRQLRFRLQPGQTVIFQQTRILHGREAFTEVEPHSRVLRGCYVNIDAFWNRVSVETQKRHPGNPIAIPRGNRSFH